MRLVIPFNSQYFRKVYFEQDDYIERLESEVVPNLTKRLAMSSAVDYIDIYSDLNLARLSVMSSKISYLENCNGNLTEFVDLFRSYSKDSGHNNGLIVVYNPLYPFLSVEKIEAAYAKVKSAEFRSGIGSYVTSRKNNNPHSPLIAPSDEGIVSIVWIEDVLETGKRMTEPCLLIKLSALEMISLRSIDDVELYDLVVNSGFNL